MENASLLELYQTLSKHSHYQTLPTALRRILPGDHIDVNSRHEEARLSFIKTKLDVTGLRVSDIGGNTGYFSFEMLDLGARSVLFFEGNKAHHDFVTLAARELGATNRLQTKNRYVGFHDGDLPDVDVTLLLNVLHHVGDDFGDHNLSIGNAKHEILRCLETLSRRSEWLIFQLGFNWKGDRHLPLFEHGTKTELIDFVSRGTEESWRIDAIGIAETSGGSIAFKDLDATNIRRDDRMGEFLNRPLFVMHSRNISFES